uniref:Uncharacterized protein n=1 Tax=Geospiza parvula TaxID=87175 RepID=A0A8C3M6E8_GEOPR
MKSRWNWGSMTCIMYLICAGSQRSMSSSRASSFSGPLQRCRETPHDPGSVSPASPATALEARPLVPGQEPEAAGSLAGHRCCVTGDTMPGQG